MNGIKNISIRVSLISTITVLSLIIISIISVAILNIYLPGSEKANSLSMSNKMADFIILATAEQAKERGFTASYLSFIKKNTAPNTEIQDKYQQFRSSGDKYTTSALQIANSLAQLNWKGDDFSTSLKNVQTSLKQFYDLRVKVDQLTKDNITISPNQWVNGATNLIESLSHMRQVAFFANDDKQEAIYDNSIVKQSIWSITEYSGRERALIASLIATKQPLTKKQLLSLNGYRAIVEHHFSLLESLAIPNLIDPDHEQVSSKMSTGWSAVLNGFMGEYQQLRLQFFDEAKTGEYSISADQWLNTSTKAINELLTFSSLVSEDSNFHSTQLKEHSDNSLIASIALLILGMLFSGIGSTIVFSIVKRTTAVQKTFETILYNKDISIRLPMGKMDEVGKLAKSYNDLISSVNSVIHEAIGSTIDVTDASATLMSVSNNTKMGIQSKEVETIETSDNLAVMIETVQQVATNSKQAAEMASQAKDESEHGLSVTQNTIASINQLASEIDHAKATIDNLKEQSHEIEGIVSAIQQIAEQTNLLALNAAIEAARAGESGRGFAVVADEVRSLASRTQDETKQIESIISKLKHSTSEASDVMNLSNEQAVTSVSQINETGEALNAISVSVNQVNSINLEIAVKTDSQVDIFSNLSGNMRMNTEQFSMMLNDSVKDTNNASNQLNDSITGLQNMIEMFHLDPNPSLQLYQAKSNMIMWKNRVNTYLEDGSIELESKDSSSHYDCKFGQWYYSNDTKYLQEVPEFVEIEPIHKLQHECLHQLQSLKQQGKDDEAKAMAVETFRHTDRMLEMLENIAIRLGIQRESKVKKINLMAADEMDDNIDFF